MKYWLIWLLGLLCGMYMMWFMIGHDSVLLTYGGVITYIIAALSVFGSVVLNLYVLVNVLINAWEIKVE